MTSAQLSYEFDILFDSIANYSSPGFTNQEKSSLLNQAQENIYLDVINPLTTPRSGAILDELNKIISAELINHTGDLIPATPATTFGAELFIDSIPPWGIVGAQWTKTGVLTFARTISGASIMSLTCFANASLITKDLTYLLSVTVTSKTVGQIGLFGVYNNGSNDYLIGYVSTNTTQTFQFVAPVTSAFGVTPYDNFDGSVTFSLKQVIIPSMGNNLPYGQFVQLPINFFFPLIEFADIQFLSTSYFYAFTNKYPNHISTNVYVKPIPQLDFNNGWWSHIRRPYEDLVWRTERERPTPTSTIGTINPKLYELFGNEEYTIYRYRATYYRRLIDIDIDNNITCELDPFIHRTLVKDAVKIAALSINDKDKYQMASIEKNN
jgi:hypothetical protein